jgi:large subunit ribosomal protein L23
MGLLDRWMKKTTAEQLQRGSEEASPSVKDEKKSEKVNPESVDKKVKKEAKTTTRTGKQKVVKSKKNQSEKKEVVSAPVAERGQYYQTIISPLITEKNTVLQAHNQYVFKVKNDANKYMVKHAVQELYGVKVQAVRMINLPGKVVRFGRTMGRRSDFKKAIVTLPKGSTITIHEAV